MKWKYVIDLTEDNAFKAMEKYYGVEVSEELKKLIEKANGGTPEKTKIVVNGEERLFGAILSFNNNEVETDSYETAKKVISDKSVLPFAIDPFGNYFCYRLKDGRIVFWNHEADGYVETGYNLDGLLSSLK